MKKTEEGEVLIVVAIDDRTEGWLAIADAGLQVQDIDGVVSFYHRQPEGHRPGPAREQARRQAEGGSAVVRRGNRLWARGHAPRDGAGQPGAVETNALAKQAQFIGRLARVPASSAADMDAELVSERCEPAFQRTYDAGGDA